MRKILQTLDSRTGARKFWKVVRSSKVSRTVFGRHPITFRSKTITSNTDIAKEFFKQFTNARIHASEKLFRMTKRKMAKLILYDSAFFSPQ